MASGKKNYFRHSFQAGTDEKIMSVIETHGKSSYFHFFRLLELCGEQAAEKIPEKFVFHPRTLCNNLLVKRNKLRTHLLHLENVALIQVEYSDNKIAVLVPNFAKYLGKYTTKKETNTPNKRKEKKRKEKETQKAPAFDFEALYQKYPLKKGKSRGLERCKAKIKTQEKYNLLNRAIDNYVTECNNRNTEKKYIKHFSTFMSDWEDWIDFESDLDGYQKSEEYLKSVSEEMKGQNYFKGFVND